MSKDSKTAPVELHETDVDANQLRGGARDGIRDYYLDDPEQFKTTAGTPGGVSSGKPASA